MGGPLMISLRLLLFVSFVASFLGASAAKSTITPSHILQKVIDNSADGDTIYISKGY